MYVYFLKDGANVNFIQPFGLGSKMTCTTYFCGDEVISNGIAFIESESGDTFRIVEDIRHDGKGDRPYHPLQGWTRPNMRTCNEFIKNSRIVTREGGQEGKIIYTGGFYVVHVFGPGEDERTASIEENTTTKAMIEYFADPNSKMKSVNFVIIG